MARRLLILALLGGCRGLLGIEDPIVGDAGNGGDAPTDAAACELTAHRFDPCTLGLPGPALHLTSGSYLFDTSVTPATVSGPGVQISTSLVQTQSDGQPVVILFIDSLSIDFPATLLVSGSRPAIIATVGDLVVSGVIDAGSITVETDAQAHVSQTARFGAGANQACATSPGGAGGNAPPTAGSGGGGGGAFAGDGGRGGTGDNNGALGGAPGQARGVPTTVRGGCGGGASGLAGQGAVAPASQNTRSQGGGGGGAIHLASRTKVRIPGTLVASGAGGAGAPQGSACGGGGGGSGGYIGLEAPRVEITGSVGAVGGGGGGGAQTSNHGNNGGNGAVGSAVGGAALACGTAGGAGGATQTAGASVDASDPCGGGGGGGGAGYILIWSKDPSTTGATITPAPMFDLN